MDISALTVQIIPITTILKNIAVLYARLLLVQIIPITTILKNGKNGAVLFFKVQIIPITTILKNITGDYTKGMA